MASRKTKVVSGVAGALLMFVAGIAVAAVLLSTSIVGQATVERGQPGSGTSNEIRVAVSNVNGSQLNCDDIGISNDFKELTFNPKLTIPANGPNGPQAVPGGECTVRITVKNTGSKPIRIDPSSAITAAPKGWVVPDLQIPAGRIDSGKEQTITAKVVARADAATGPITGKLVYTDAG